MSPSTTSSAAPRPGHRPGIRRRNPESDPREQFLELAHVEQPARLPPPTNTKPIWNREREGHHEDRADPAGRRPSQRPRHEEQDRLGAPQRGCRDTAIRENRRSVRASSHEIGTPTASNRRCRSPGAFGASGCSEEDRVAAHDEQQRHLSVTPNANACAASRRAAVGPGARRASTGPARTRGPRGGRAWQRAPR